MGSHKDDETERSKSYLEAKRAGMRRPLHECDLSKNEVKLLAKMLGIPSRRKRAPKKNLNDAKKMLEKAGAKKAKVLAKGNTIYLCAGKTELVMLAKKIDAIKKKMQSLGFSNVLLKPLS